MAEQESIQSVGWLEQRLRSAGRKLYVTERLTFIITVICTFLLAFAVYGLSDYLVAFPRYVRLVITLLIIGGTIMLVRRFAPKWVRELSNTDQVAREVENVQYKKGQSQKSLIISALEFGLKPHIRGSMVLKNAVINGSRTLCVDPASVVLYNISHVKTARLVLISTILIFAVWTLLALPYFIVFMQRLALLNVHYPTATKMVSLDWKEIAPARRDYPVMATVDGKIPPSGVMTVKYPGRKPFDISMEAGVSNSFQALVPVPDTDFSFRFVLGDYASDYYKVNIQVPPSVKEGTLDITPPKYTKLPTRKCALGSTSAQEGSAVTFRILPAQPLISCDIITSNKVITLKADKNGWYSGSLEVAHPTTYEVKMVSDKNLENSDRVSFLINTVNDMAPKIDMSRPKPNSFASEISVIAFEADIKDDFGLTSAAMDYEVFFKGEKDETEKQVRKGSIPVTISTNDKSERVTLLKPMKDFSAKVGERIVFRLVAIDNKAGKASAGESDQIPVFVVSPEEMRRTIQQEQERTAELIGKIKDDEKNQADAIRRRIGGKKG